MDFTASLYLHTPQSQQVKIYDVNGKEFSIMDLPQFFTAPLRQELVRRAFVHLATHSLQPKGASKLSGHKHSVESWGPGFGMARISRIKGRGSPKYGAGGMVPSAVGGRPTHPPAPEKRIHKEINKKELRNALISALAFTANAEYVRARGHRVPEALRLPIIVDDAFEDINKARNVITFLLNLGLGNELKRCEEIKVRAGKGKRRGRRYKRRKGPLIIVSKRCNVLKAASSIPGVDIVEARNLSVLDLAPGGHPGRLTIYTKSSLDVLGERLK